jgi:hypothetical protein
MLFNDSGINVCARLDDPEAQPMWLEDIPGYDKFLKDVVALWTDGRLVMSPYLWYSAVTEGVSSPAAMLDSVGNWTSLYVQQNYQTYSVYPLMTGNEWCPWLRAARIPKVSSGYELLIPAKSRRAAEAMGFVQWLYQDQDNALTAVFGQQAEGYSRMNGRITVSSSALQAVTEINDHSWAGGFLFSFAVGPCIPIGAPDNSEALLNAWPPAKFAAPWLGNTYEAPIALKIDGDSALSLRIQQWQWLQQQLFSDPGAEGLDVDAFLENLRNFTNEKELTTIREMLAQAKAMPQEP